MSTTKANAPPRRRPAPSGLPLDFLYAASRDGVDNNLLIVLHGLGDTCKPFLDLGARLTLPQTAVLALNAPSRLPLLDGDHWQWVDAFDLTTGDVRHHTDVSVRQSLHRTRAKLLETVQRLTQAPYNYLASQIFVLGYAQGGALAVDLALQTFVGGAISINGPPFSVSLAEAKTKQSHILLLFASKTERDTVDQLLKYSSNVTYNTSVASSTDMPRSKDEWYPFMKFIEKRLALRNLALEEMSDIIEIK
ncbi:hypothetical protein RI367_003521 [Sorochytrium milnesiophthora]